MITQDLVSRAREFGSHAHRRIDQTRNYTQQPYEVHLKAVSQLLAEVTDDAEVIAAAWLHDTVEDTEATLEDIRSEFGDRVARLVGSMRFSVSGDELVLYGGDDSRPVLRFRAE